MPSDMVPPLMKTIKKSKISLKMHFFPLLPYYLIS